MHLIFLYNRFLFKDLNFEENIWWSEITFPHNVVYHIYGMVINGSNHVEKLCACVS